MKRLRPWTLVSVPVEENMRCLNYKHPFIKVLCNQRTDLWAAMACANWVRVAVESSLI